MSDRLKRKKVTDPSVFSLKNLITNSICCIVGVLSVIQLTELNIFDLLAQNGLETSPTQASF